MKLLLTVALLGTALVPLGERVNAESPIRSEGETSELENALSPETQRALAFGYSALLSDWYWLQAIQYYGTPSNAQQRYRRLPDFLEAATDLDPEFAYVYQFAGQSLPFDDGTDHRWHNVGAAIHLLEKGMASSSTRWQIPWLLGYCLYTFEGKYAEAGRVIAVAALRPHAPPYLRSLSLRLLAAGGQLDTAIEMTQRALSGVPEGRERSQMQERLNALLLQKQLTSLNSASGIRSVPSNGTMPMDPYGDPFYLDHSTGRFESRNEDKLLRLYVHPGEPAMERMAD
jgi:tetratricopeptide (TPR) repeat protein